MRLEPLRPDAMLNEKFPSVQIPDGSREGTDSPQTQNLIVVAALLMRSDADEVRKEIADGNPDAATCDAIRTAALMTRVKLPGAFRRSYWRHALRTAEIAKDLVTQFRPAVDPRELLAAAWMHDAGKLVYAVLFPVETERIERLCAEEGCLWTVAENYYQLPSHADFGTRLTENLSFSDTVRRTCAEHGVGALEKIVDSRKVHDEATFWVGIASMIDHLLDGNISDETRFRLRKATRRALALADGELDRLLEGMKSVQEPTDHLLRQLVRAAA